MALRAGGGSGGQLMYFREVIFGQPQEIPKTQIRGDRIALLAAAILIEVAWHYGIITSLALTSRDFIVKLWNMLSDAFAFFMSLPRYFPS